MLLLSIGMTNISKHKLKYIPNPFVFYVNLLVIEFFMRFFWSFLVVWVSFSGFSQVPDEEELYHHNWVEQDSINMREFAIERKDNDTLIKSNDLFYREDQFYFGLTYNLLQNRSQGISQNAFSAGIHMGFLRDIPLNKDRNVGIAIGAGYSFSNYRTNMHISEVGNDIHYAIAEDFDRSKLSLHFLEVPIEFRWRTSTPKNTKFWRIYTGFKVSYLTFSRSKITGNFPSETILNNPDFSKFLYGAYLSVGHGSITFYAHYTLNPIFKNAYIEGERINLTSLNLGLMFYIL